MSCGTTITRSTTLRSDVGPCPGDGLVVTADNAVPDVNRFTPPGPFSPQNTDSLIAYNDISGNGVSVVVTDPHTDGFDLNGDPPCDNNTWWTTGWAPSTSRAFGAIWRVGPRPWRRRRPPARLGPTRPSRSGEAVAPFPGDGVAWCLQPHRDGTLSDEGRPAHRRD